MLGEVAPRNLYFSVEKMAEFAFFVFSNSILILYIKNYWGREKHLRIFSGLWASKGCAQKILIVSAEKKNETNYFPRRVLSWFWGKFWVKILREVLRRVSTFCSFETFSDQTLIFYMGMSYDIAFSFKMKQEFTSS